MRFDKKVYEVHENGDKIAPMLMLNKPSTCCINIRAELTNMSANATRELYTLCMYVAI